MSQPAGASEADRQHAKVDGIIDDLRSGADRLHRTRVDAGSAAAWGQVMREVAAWLADIAHDVHEGCGGSAGTSEQCLAEQRTRLISARDAAWAAIGFRDPIVVSMTAAVSWIASAAIRLHGSCPDQGID